MLQKIVKGYGNLFAGTARILALLGLCTLVGACIVLPLWAFATKAPALYTALVLILLIAGISLFLVKKALAAGIRRTVQVLLQLLIIGSGTAGAILLVLHGLRFAALADAAATFVLYGICSFGFSSSAHEKNSETGR